VINLLNLDEGRPHLLEMSKGDYKAIFENTGAASIVIRKDHLILLANKKFEKISGYGRNKIEGEKKWTEFVIEDDCPKVQKCIWQKEPTADEVSDTCEFRLIDQSGNIKYFLAVITEIPSTNTAVMSLINITDLKLAEEALKQKELELEKKSYSLEEANITLKVLLNHNHEGKAVLEEQMLANYNKLIVPAIENLKRLRLSNKQIVAVQVLEKQLQDIISPFVRNMSIASLDLTPRQIQIAKLIQEGMTSREIAESLCITPVAVGFHRRNLRSKLGILKNGKISLRSYLISSYS
jgi:PAS domain S-box-containing protein